MDGLVYSGGLKANRDLVVKDMHLDVSDLINLSAGWIAPENGILRLYGSPASSSTGYVIIKESAEDGTQIDYSWLRVNCFGGCAETNAGFVKKSHKYSISGKGNIQWHAYYTPVVME